MFNKNIELDCKICNKYFNNYENMPRIIPNCGHTICAKCLYKEFLKNNKKFKCPFD